MKTRIEIPVWLLITSAGLHLLWTVGLIVVLVAGSLRPVPIDEVVTATPLPPTAATVVLPTATSLPPTATRVPVATAVLCANGEVPGVDCVLDVDGIAVTVVSLERNPTFTDSAGSVWEPKDEVSDEFLIIHLLLPAGTVKEDLDVWFEDGGAHAPRLEDGAGNEVPDFVFALIEKDDDEGFGVQLVFVIPKGATDLTLRIQGEATVELSLVPDTTSVTSP